MTDAIMRTQTGCTRFYDGRAATSGCGFREDCVSPPHAHPAPLSPCVLTSSPVLASACSLSIRLLLLRAARWAAHLAAASGRMREGKRAMPLHVRVRPVCVPCLEYWRVRVERSPETGRARRIRHAPHRAGSGTCRQSSGGGRGRWGSRRVEAAARGTGLGLSGGRSAGTV